MTKDSATYDQNHATTGYIVDFIAAAARDAASCESREISDVDLARLLTAGVKLYAARAEATEVFPPPLVAQEATATEVVTAVCEMLRVVNVNMFDLSMWFGRRNA